VIGQARRRKPCEPSNHHQDMPLFRCARVDDRSGDNT
jgi:hypothetical protein